MKLELARTDLATIIKSVTTDDVAVIDHLPDSIAIPCVMIGWADPWLKSSTYCAYEAAMEVMIIAQRIEPGGKLVTLEEIVAAIVPALKGTAYTVVDVTAPFPMQLSGVDYLAASINVTYDMEV